MAGVVVLKRGTVDESNVGNPASTTKASFARVTGTTVKEVSG